MRVLIILTTFFSIYGMSVTAAGATGDSSAGAAKAEDCAACHNALVSLKGRGAEAISKQINAIRAGDQSHPPGLGELSEEDIADIAAYLDGA